MSSLPPDQDPRLSPREPGADPARAPRPYTDQPGPQRAPGDGDLPPGAAPGRDGPQLRGYGYGDRDAYGPFLRQSHQAQVSQVLATLHRYELTLRKHWWILVLALCAALGPVTWYIYTTPPGYRSKAKVWMSGKLNIKEGQLYNEELTSFLGTQVELFKSVTIYNRALAKVLKEHPSWAPFLTVTNSELKAIKLEVSEFPRTSIIELEAVGNEADPTRVFLDTVMDEYQAFRKELRSQSSDVTVTSIVAQVEKQELELRQQQDKMHNFMASNNVVLLTEQGSSAGAFVARLNRQLAGLRTEYELLKMLTPEQLTQASTKTRSPTEETGIGDDSSKDLLMSLSGPQTDFFKANQQIDLLKAQRAELSQYLRPNHPKIIKLDEDLATQMEVVEVFRRQSLSQMDNRRQAIEIQITGLETSIKEWEAKALDSSRRMADYERLRQDVQRTQGLYERLLAVIQSVDVNRTLDQESVRVMEHASTPKKVRRTAKFLALGGGGGLMLGFGLIYLLSMFDDRCASISELRNHLGELIIGQIPLVRVPPPHQFIDLVSDNDERHAFAESFRNIRSWIRFSYTEKDRPRTMLVTSSLPAEGKSTITANLAATLALAGSRVLLVDADLRRAGLHRRFGVPNTPGFAEILEQETRCENAIVPTRTPKLFLLPAGEAKVNPGELFLAPSLDLFLARIRDQYDYILFDSAPVMATDDTSNLAPKLEGLLFVMRADFTSARSARESLSLLRQRHVNVLGLIFNRAIPTRTESYYYNRYSDYYHYSSKPGKDGRSKRRHHSGTVQAAAADKDQPASS